LATPCEDGVTAALVAARLLWEQHESRCDSRYDIGASRAAGGPMLGATLISSRGEKG
jgi:hypothetical protein